MKREAGRIEREPDRRPPVLFVVDDDVATVELLCDLAGDRGWVAHKFARLDELRRALTDAHPTLVIIDDDLPDGRGGDEAQALRRDPATADVPLLVCTAAHPMRQAEIGAWAPVVSKPFDLDEVERFLDAAARPRGGAEARIGSSSRRARLAGCGRLGSCARFC